MFWKILQEIFKFFCFIKWKKKEIWPKPEHRIIWNIYADMENTNIAAENVEGVRYALITGKRKPVKIAEGLKYVGITGKKINAKIVEGVRYAPITGKKLTAKSVKGLKYAPITDKNLTARSVVIRLK